MIGINNNEGGISGTGGGSVGDNIEYPIITSYVVPEGNKCCYSKSSDGIVIVHLALYQKGGFPTAPLGGLVIGRIPVEYAPSDTVGETSYWIDPDGRIKVSSLAGMTGFRKTFVFRM